MKSRSGHQKRKKRPKNEKGARRRAMAVKVSSSIETLRALSAQYAYGDPVSAQGRSGVMAPIGVSTAPCVGSGAVVGPSPSVHQ
jgi:hypothetical protein